MPFAPHRKLLVLNTLLLAALAAAVILLLPRPDEKPGPSVPAGNAPDLPGPDLTSDYADAEEDAVWDVEDMMIDLAQQIRRRAWDGAAYFVAEDFEGSPLLREPAGAGRLVGAVTVRTDGPDSRRLDRAAFRKSLEAIDVTQIVFKFPSARLDGDRILARLKVDALRSRARRATRWVSQGDAEFVRRGGRWVLRRFAGTDVRTEEAEERFLEATGRLGFPRTSGDDDAESPYINFGRLFLGGIAAGDFDGDGDTDLSVPQVGPDLFFRNEGGRFVECARELGVANPDSGAGSLFLDFDNDGDLDLLVSSWEPAQLRDAQTKQLRDNAGRRALALYRNEGGRFQDVTEPAGLVTRGPAMSAVAADVDGDGDLDLYVCMYRDESQEDPRFAEEIPADIFNARNGVPNQLWINQGDGTFREEAVRRGVADTGWSLAAGFADYDGDGDADLYVANDYGQTRLFRNRGDGTFEDRTAASGAGDTGFGMGVTWLDYDGDGHLDVYVSNMYSTAGNRILARGHAKLSAERLGQLKKMARGNTLLRNLGDGTFRDVTKEAGVGPAGWAWGTQAYDYDHDARPDLYVANGFRTSAFANADL